MSDAPDFIASELLGELKAGNERKDAQIRQLHRNILIIIGVFVLAILAIIVVGIWYLSQYDFASESTITSNASGVYALIDSSGNIIADDITPQEIEGVLNGKGIKNDNSQNIADSQEYQGD